MNNDILLSTKFKSIREDATVSMPSQIKALFGMNPQIDVRLIDYDYIGDAKDDDYTSFAEKLYKANPNAHYILVTHSNELKDSLLVRKTFHFDLTGFINLLERALLPIKNRYGENQDVIISMASVCQHKKDIMVLYPYGGTDFGSFMLFVV